MPRARLTLNGDWVYTDKDWRIYKLTQEAVDKINSIPWVIDDVNSMSTTDALSANMGRELQEQINNLSGALRYLSGWDCTTGLPTTDPIQDPYQYSAWCFYIVSNVWETNYKPHWAYYRRWVASSAIETEDVQVNDWYMYDWLVWSLIHNAWWGEIVVDDYLSTTSTNPVQNRVITNAINNKQDTLIAWRNITIENNVISASWWWGWETYTAWENIQISADNVISATDTTYEASDFDIKDLSDSTHLKQTWGDWAALAATALQPWDNITELNNNAEFTVDKVLTQAEYDALWPSTQTDGKRYLIYSTVE